MEQLPSRPLFLKSSRQKQGTCFVSFGLEELRFCLGFINAGTVRYGTACDEQCSGLNEPWFRGRNRILGTCQFKAEWGKSPHEFRVLPATVYVQHCWRSLLQAEHIDYRRVERKKLASWEEQLGSLDRSWTPSFRKPRSSALAKKKKKKSK